MNSLPLMYNNVVFTLSQLSSQSLDDMISTLLAEDKTLSIGDSKSLVHLDNALFI